MEDRLPGREYYLELRGVREALVKTVARVEALDLEEKPEELAVGGLSLRELVSMLDDAIELTDDAARQSQIMLAVEGVAVEDQEE